MMNNFLLGSLLILTTLCTGTAAAGFNESCTVDFNCTESDPNTQCSDDSVCVCNDNYVYSTNKCISILNVTVTPPPTIKIGGDVTISCVLNGQPTATGIQWKRNDSVLDIGNTAKYTGGSVATPSLTIKSVTRGDAGSYQCLATNDAGTGESNKVTLTTMDRQYGDSCGDDFPCDDSKDLQCVNNKCECKNTHYPNNNVCYDRKQLNEACNSVMLCVNEPQVTCNGGVCACNTGYYDDNGQTTGGSCQARKQLNEACSSVMPCVDEPQVTCNADVCVCNTGYYDDNGQTTGGSCQARKQLNGACDSVMLCVDEPHVTCNGGVCVCNTGYYDDNGQTTGGSCQARKQLNGACDSVMLCVDEPHVTCNGGVCVCNTGYYDDNGQTTGGSCQARKQLNGACDSVMLCVDETQVTCNGSVCVCNTGYYDDNGQTTGGSCQARKQLNGACDSVMLCVDEPHVTCNGSVCVCNTGYYDDNGLASGGSCKARKNLGDSCSTIVLCLENIRCASDNKCRCPNNTYDDNKNNPNGTCRDITELKVTAFTLSVTTDTITVTWTPPTTHTYVSRYDVGWRITGTGSAYSNTSAGTANTLTINQGLKAGQAYDVFIESVDNYTQVVEQKIASDTKVVRLNPNTPGSISNPSVLDAPNINLMWTESPSSEVTKYMVTVVQIGATENTTNNTPRLLLQTMLVPGTYYNINITAVSGTPSAPGGETYSVAHEERIRTMVEKPSPPVNVKCPVNPKDRSLEITWSAPDHPNGIIQYYEVYVYYANGTTKEEINTTGAVTTFNVQNLTPESTFGFAVSAVNDGDESIRTSDMTTRIYCTTKAALSTMPLNLTVSNIESRNFTVTFNKPATTNGRLTGYVVFVYQEEKTPQKCVQKILFQCSDCGNNYTFIQPNQTCLGKVIYQDVSNLPDTPSISYLVMDLLPYMDYTVETAGINAAGEGNLAPLQNFIKTGQEEPNKPTITAVTDIGQTQMKLQWNIAGPRPGPTNITVTVYEIIGNTRSVNKTVLFESAFDRTDFILIDLEEYWDYQFTVTAATVIGSVTSEMSDVIRTLPTAPGKVLDLTVVKASSDNYTAVQVSWKIPPLHQRNSYLDKYIIVQNFTTGSNNNVEIPVNLNLETNMQMFSVTPETYYSVEVYAKNNETTSNSTGEKSQMIYYAPPGPPKTTTVQSVVTTAPGGEQAQTKTFVVELNIDPFSDNTNGQVEYYGLVVCRRDKYIELTVQQGALSDEWRNLPNYQTAKNEGYPPYRVTDGRFIQRVTQTMIQGRRKRSTTFQYPIGSETCANNTYYCNGPLPADTSFNVVVFICTAGGCSHSGPLGPYKTKAFTPEEGAPIGIIVGVLAAVVAVTVVVIVFIVVRHRRRKPSTQKSYRDFNDVDNDSHDAEMDRIERNRPFLLSDINQVVATKHKDSNLLFAREYEELKNISPKHPTESSELDANKLKNRYVNILPFDHSRVKLLPTDDEPDSDFINANYLPGYKLQREYIGAQGPIPGTVDDFWRMIWEQNVGIVIMLTLCKEDGRVKCEPYWPMDLHEVKQYGEITVETVNVSTVNTYDFRIFKLKLGNENRSLKHFHFLQWKDFSANVQNDTMIEFIKNVRSHIQPPDKNGPIVVHCSAGVGRTGTFIALDHLLQFIDDHDFDSSVDIFDLVLKLRENRMFMVQTEQQYIFIHDVVRDYLERKRKAQQGEDLYQNVNLAFEPDENMYENVSSKKTEL